MQTLEHYDRAMRLYANDPARWRALNRAAAAIRDGATVYEPYKWRIVRPVRRWMRLRFFALRLAHGPYRHD